jgi:nicotinamidase-related amidase
MSSFQVDAQPYIWPFDGQVTPARVAFVVIDMQFDFCGKGGYVDSMGYDLALMREPIAPIRRCLDVVRSIPEILVIHTREGHRPQLLDLPANKAWRSRNVSPGIGEPGPNGRLLVRGEPGWEIIPELSPLAHEIVIDKPGKGSFYATDLELVLHTAAITHLVLTGITTDVCVHTTMRDANDRGFECLLLTDCTAATEKRHWEAAISMIHMQGGVFGATSTSDRFIGALRPLAGAVAV